MGGSTGIRRELRPLSAHAAASLSGQLGVFEVVVDGRTVLIGTAGGREPFGLRSAVQAVVDDWPDASFRYETTHAYLTRWHELIMRHIAEHGSAPVGNPGAELRVGRLR